MGPLASCLIALVQADAGWSTDLGASLARARESEAVLCVVVADDSPASLETLRSMEDESVRSLTGRFVRVRLAAGAVEEGVVSARWAPTLLLFQTVKPAPPSPEDEQCLRSLREVRISLSMREASIDDVISIFGRVTETRFIFDPTAKVKARTVSLECSNETAAQALRNMVNGAGLDYAVMEGVILLASKERMPAILLKRELHLAFQAKLEALPELGEDDRAVTELLERRIDVHFHEDKRVGDAVTRLNRLLGAEIIKADESVSRAVIGGVGFEGCTLRAVLSTLEAEPNFVWYQKGGKVILSNRPELVPLTPPRLRNFILASLEGDESILPAGAVKEIEGHALRLGADAPEERAQAERALKEWILRFETTKRVLRRLRDAATDPESKARLKNLLELKRSP